MMRDVATDENHVHREHHGAAEYQRIAAIQAAESFGRHGEKIEASERGQRSGPDPGVDATLAENGEQQRNDHYARAGDERRLRRRREFQAGGLKGVSGEHEETDLRAGPDGTAREP